MKIRSDVIRMYKEVHGWVGIIAGLALFIAFYAGAITMFEDSLQRWASPPTRLAPPPSLARTPELIAKLLAAHPEAAKDHDVHVAVDGNRPARVSWEAPHDRDDHGPAKIFYASLDEQGALVTTERQPSPVGQFVDILHQQIGLPFRHEVAMPIMGAIALLYAIAIVSGTVVLLPSLVSDLFAVRVSRNVKRMWLDVHNVLGLFSLPFHLVMALTAIVFAFHDQFYDAQGIAFGKPERPAARAAPPPPPGPPLAPVAIVRALERQAPGFRPVTLGYSTSPEGKLSLRVGGTDPRYGLRGPTAGFAGVDPYTGRLLNADYLPGHQDGWSATITSFFALHFGSFGGVGVRWVYVLLGLAGAMLFYTGNLLWVESRRKRERKAGAVEQTRSTKVLASLTIGVPLGCVAGISATVAAAKLIGGSATMSFHSAVYYAVFLGFTVWAVVRGAARAGFELTIAAALASLAIPGVSAWSGTIWYRNGSSPLIDGAAVLLSLALWMMARSFKQRTLSGPRDSVWAAEPALQRN